MSDCDKDHCRYDHDAVTKVWEALGNPPCDGRYIWEYVAEVVAHVAAMQALVYVPKITDSDDVITYADEAARLLREKTAMQAELDATKAKLDFEYNDGRGLNALCNYAWKQRDEAIESFRQRAVAAVRALSDNQLNRTMICAMLQQLPATTTEGGE